MEAHAHNPSPLDDEAGSLGSAWATETLVQNQRTRKMSGCLVLNPVSYFSTTYMFLVKLSNFFVPQIGDKYEQI